MSVMRDAGDQAAKEKNSLGKPLLISGTLLVFLFTVKSFGMSFGQVLPAAMKQTVNVNEKLQRVTGTLPLAAKLKNASGGPDKKIRRVIGGSILETWIGTGNPLKINTKSPLASRFLQTDPMSYHDSMNLYQAMNQNPLNFVDPMGEWKSWIHIDMTDKAWKEKDYKTQIQGGIWNRINNQFWNIHPSYFSPFNSNEDLFGKALISGSWWQDVPGNSNRSTEYYHVMYNDVSNWKEYRKLVMIQMLNWVMEADINRIYELHINAGESLGKAVHLIQDAFCPPHMERDPETLQIVQVYDYKKQDKSEHTFLETPENVEDFYNLALNATKKFLKLYFTGNTRLIKKFLLEEVFVFSENVKMGGGFEKKDQRNKK